MALFFLCTGLSAPVYRQATGIAKNAHWLLPLGYKRAAIFLWLWKVPMMPLLTTIVSLPFYLWHNAHVSFLDSAQLGLWTAGLLAYETLPAAFLRRCSATRCLAWITAVPWLATVLFVSPLLIFSSDTLDAIASGKYALALNICAPGMIFLSFQALRFHPREEDLGPLPLTKQAAARYLDLNGGAWARIFSALHGGIRVDRLSGHWLPQLLARCFLRTSSVFMVVLVVLVHYGVALAPRTYAPTDYWFLIFLILSSLTPADPRTLRRLPLSASMIAALTVFLTLFAAAFFTLPTFAFQRVPGSLGVEFFPANLFSLQALGSVVAYAGLVMLCWMLWMCFPRLSGGSFIWVSVLWGLPPTVIGFMMHALHAGFDSEQDGWRSDLLVGGFLLLGSATLYAILLRRGHRLYNPTAKGGSRPVLG
jgi:hypothetical protein